MSKVLLVIGICQIVAGVVVVGLVGKKFHDAMESSGTVAQVNAFGPVLIGLLVIVNGVFGVLTMFCSSNKKMDVFYLMGATVAGCGAAAMVWIYSLAVYQCDELKKSIIVKCADDTYDIYISLLVFSIICCAMSVFGMVVSSLTVCRKL